MNLHELLHRVDRWEDLHTEFKEESVHQDEIAAALVAFANTDGGQLIFGVDKSRRIVGVADPDRLMQRVDQIAYQNCEPPVTVLQETMRVEDGQTVVVVHVPTGDQRPYRTHRGDYFIRTTSGRRRASRQELLRLFQSAESLYYDETLIRRAGWADIDRYAFEHYVRRAYHSTIEELNTTYEDLLRNLGYVRAHAGSEHPTLACLLFFGRDPQRFIPPAYIAAARVPGVDLSSPPSDNKQLMGTLPDLLEDMMRFLNIYLPKAHRIKGLEPEVYPELPEEALRELLVNALAHRDYTISAPIRLFIFDDHVEIRTPGGLPNTVTIEAIRLGGAHVLRNPTLYTLFSRLGLVTGVGTGIYRAIRQIQQTTGQTPALFLQGNEFVVSIPRPQKDRSDHDC